MKRALGPWFAILVVACSNAGPAVSADAALMSVDATRTGPPDASPDARSPDAAPSPDAASADAALPDAASADAAPPDPNVSLALTLADSMIEIPRKDSGSVGVTLVRTGNVGAVTLSLVSPPTGVSGTFTPATPTGDSATLTISVASNATLGEKTLTVKGTAGTLTATTTLILDVLVVEGLPIAGAVRDANGVAVVGATVTATGGFSDTTLSGGRFTISAAPRPYDLVAVSKDGRQVVRFEGLTRDNPTIYFVAVPPARSQATVQGTYAPAGGAAGALAFGAGARRVETVTSSWGDADTFDAGLAWGGATVSGTLHVLRSSGALAHGALDGVSLKPGVAVSGLEVALTPIEESGTLGGTVTAPDGALGIEVMGMVAWDDGARIAFSVADAPSFNLPVPVIAGAELELAARAELPGGASSTTVSGPLVAGDDAIAVSTPSPPERKAPAAGAQVGAATSFSWTPFAGGLVVLYAAPVGDAPTYAVVTAGTATTLPLAAAPPPPGQAYTWSLFGLAPYADVDAISGAPSVLGTGFAFTALPPRGESSASAGSPRAFTVSP